ncbi:thiol-disulfide oxidoreductase [Serratia quinivorans]|jgi:cytochrome c biogenesis protein CcdA/thiol-disulfide isomerase/thioredoxin|uniref:cytochrome c biogenesis protein DipZ n=1 Tax=Serratia quinivorans TaxID=137545 RepID=UPI0021777A4E|nr:cytochrome c biogenesis protein DipZ [Serratia quinivorans]CAI0996282.1 thiol-disulfide oxidoreductase [Serratia quinivorans]CAI1021905.1 thiol-disulfide oxidoreductase [Serratia quinivorans]CAI1037256.1 thiol-disulfide oxidoreductase [Serratia quinivorans]CAI1842181.1 thiol-disulfide oxidoreductase [Serratia quinivorans]CAI1880252.1 thiol-disulfide oxidoreductase [Serratia quinivorans]
MLILILAYLGGILTIASPCILPVLPFIFSRADRPFLRSGLPLLVGMALTFALFATLAAVGGGWVVTANQYGRWLALVLMAVFGITLLFPAVAERVMHPLVSAGNRLSDKIAADQQHQVGPSLLLGVATGLLWAPCAGPILGLVLTGAALQGANVGSTFLLLAYAAGAATSLALALLIGGKVFSAMKRSLGAGEWIRRVLGAAMLVGVVAIALGLDTTVLARISAASTGGIEQRLVQMFTPAATPAKLPVQTAVDTQPVLDDLGEMPALSGAVQWLNSPPLTTESLRGKVVLVDFWTYSCINCLRTLPYVKAWAEKYRDQGLVVIGVHAPEFAFERDIGNVTKEAKKLGIDYPIAIDNNYSIWRAFNNQYWPAHYFIDASGHIRYQHFGEGDYSQSERVIQELLRQAGAKNISSTVSQVAGQGVEQAAGNQAGISPETYLGYARAENFASGKAEQDMVARYGVPANLPLNDWGLAGNWTVGGENVTLNAPNGRIIYRFHARDLHLVLGPVSGGKPVAFKVTLDGKAPGEMHGADIAPDGRGVVTDQQLYQLIRQNDGAGEHTFSIEFEQAGVAAYAFTFG